MINHAKWKFFLTMELLFKNVIEDVMEIFSLKWIMNFLFKLPAELINWMVYYKL